MNKAGGYLQIMFFSKNLFRFEIFMQTSLIRDLSKTYSNFSFFFFFYWYISIIDRSVSKPHKYLGLRARIHLLVLQPV